MPLSASGPSRYVVQVTHGQQWGLIRAGQRVSSEPLRAGHRLIQRVLHRDPVPGRSLPAAGPGSWAEEACLEPAQRSPPPAARRWSCARRTVGINLIGQADLNDLTTVEHRNAIGKLGHLLGPWLAITTVKPSVRLSSRTVAKTSWVPTGSSCEVGSSSTRRSGHSASDDAIARRCFSPPESVCGGRFSVPSRRTAARALRCASGSRHGHTEVLEGESNLVLNRRRRDLRLRVLEDDGNVPGEPADRVIEESSPAIAPRTAPHRTGERRRSGKAERGLACAGRSDQTQEFAPADLERDCSTQAGPSAGRVRDPIENSNRWVSPLSLAPTHDLQDRRTRRCHLSASDRHESRLNRWRGPA